MIKQVEIICLAIRALDADIEHYREITNGNEQLFKSVTSELNAKRDVLCTLYKIETGTEYV